MWLFTAQFEWAFDCYECKMLLLTSTETDLPTDFEAADLYTVYI